MKNAKCMMSQFNDYQREFQLAESIAIWRGNQQGEAISDSNSMGSI